MHPLLRDDAAGAPRDAQQQRLPLCRSSRPKFVSHEPRVLGGALPTAAAAGGAAHTAPTEGSAPDKRSRNLSLARPHASLWARRTMYDPLRGRVRLCSRQAVGTASGAHSAEAAELSGAHWSRPEAMPEAGPYLKLACAVTAP